MKTGGSKTTDTRHAPDLSPPRGSPRRLQTDSGRDHDGKRDTTVTVTATANATRRRRQRQACDGKRDTTASVMASTIVLAVMLRPGRQAASLHTKFARVVRRCLARAVVLLLASCCSRCVLSSCYCLNAVLPPYRPDRGPRMVLGDEGGFPKTLWRLQTTRTPSERDGGFSRLDGNFGSSKTVPELMAASPRPEEGSGGFLRPLAALQDGSRR